MVLPTWRAQHRASMVNTIIRFGMPHNNKHLCMDAEQLAVATPFPSELFTGSNGEKDFDACLQALQNMLPIQQVGGYWHHLSLSQSYGHYMCVHPAPRLMSKSLQKRAHVCRWWQAKRQLCHIKHACCWNGYCVHGGCHRQHYLQTT